MSFRGYGNGQEFTVQGYVFRGMALPSQSTKRKSLKNLIQLIKMFVVRTVAAAEVRLEAGGQVHRQKTNQAGFFEFKVQNPGWPDGWHRAAIRLESHLVEGQETVAVPAEIRICSAPQRVVVSDIDDTLLVSHITKIWRKIYLLVSRNPQSRKPFKGVAEFYRQLHHQTLQPFYYVSSSEWNLYDFLTAFMRFHALPKGVLQLKDLKTSWKDFFKSSLQSHSHKRDKIERLLQVHHPAQFILIGDNGQQDPYLYRQLAELYPEQIEGVLIRKISHAKAAETEALLATLNQFGIPFCLFNDSAEAEHFCREKGWLK